MNAKTPAENAQDEQYKVVALKYRPQSFGDLVGQVHIATALSNAIDKNRVGHAYLFTGARGVGKTSSARIFAKCLNCEKGPTIAPCNQCDVCDTVSVGEDVDVLEIDGASNRGIDEIRQLRSNVSVRPSRSRYKIYIIDEVHMLTTPAFNALLKTLEEPPSHVKFIFCTTDPQKIPITVLSRCQRFDFSPVQTEEIANRLQEIAENEGVEVNGQALALLARRANGSMRDSQSLLEQLFSFAGNEITVNDVHQLLGTADMSRIAGIATAMTNCDSTETLNSIHTAMTDGADAGQMADQLLGYFRDMMAVRVGCSDDTLLFCTADDIPLLSALAEKLGLETILTIVQLLDGAMVRMQSSLHARTLLESAAIRICNLEKLDSISDLVNQLSIQGASEPAVKAPVRARSKVQMQQVDYRKSNPAGASKKNDLANQCGAQTSTGQPGMVASKDEKSSDAEAEVASSVSAKSVATEQSNHKMKNTVSNSQATTTDFDVEAIWKKLLSDLGDMTADLASDYEGIERPGSGHLIVTLPDSVSRDLCAKPDRKQKFEAAWERLTGDRIRIDFRASQNANRSDAAAPRMTRVQQIRKLQEVSIVQETISLFDAEITGYQESMRTKKG